MTLKDDVSRETRRYIALALIQYGHNRTHTAAGIGISRRTLLNKIRNMGLKTRADVYAAAGLPLPSTVAAEPAGGKLVEIAIVTERDLKMN